MICNKKHEKGNIRKRISYMEHYYVGIIVGINEFKNLKPQ